MLRVVQLTHPAFGRRVAIVEEPKLRLVSGFSSIYAAAQRAIESGNKLTQVLAAGSTAELLDYDLIYNNDDFKLLTPFDHPTESSCCLIMGTGLTHKASAEMRQAMHGKPADLTDSMKMYRIGLEGGRPEAGCIGAAPEWFYKGTGRILRAHNQPLQVPSHGDDGGEEAEIAGCYVIGPDGSPYRVGLAQGNEFSDHVRESKNYLYLAESKLRGCSLGPELLIDGDFSDIPGQTRILRNGEPIWQGKLASGEKWMCHTLANLEHHHFKNEAHRVPGDVHIHFLGADEFSFKDKLRLEDGDIMEIQFHGFGRPLRNPIHIDRSPRPFVAVKSL